MPLTSCLARETMFPDPENTAVPAWPAGAWTGGSAGRHTSVSPQPGGAGDGGVRQGDSWVHSRAS
jgi:hypothetical protein